MIRGRLHRRDRPTGLVFLNWWLQGTAVAGSWVVYGLWHVSFTQGTFWEGITIAVVPVKLSSIAGRAGWLTLVLAPASQRHQTTSQRIRSVVRCAGLTAIASANAPGEPRASANA